MSEFVRVRTYNQRRQLDLLALQCQSFQKDLIKLFKLLLFAIEVQKPPHYEANWTNWTKSTKYLLFHLLFKSFLISFIRITIALKKALVAIRQPQFKIFFKTYVKFRQFVVDWELVRSDSAFPWQEPGSFLQVP